MENKLSKTEQPCTIHSVISRLLLIKRYNTATCAGYAESGDVWTELDEDNEGELVKFEDVQKIIDELNGL